MDIFKGQRYFVQMHPLETFCGILAFKTSNSRERWVECEIVEERYKLSDEYKVELRALNPMYGKETFYWFSFVDMVKSGSIIKKSSDNQHVEDIAWIEPLCRNVYLHHSASVIVPFDALTNEVQSMTRTEMLYFITQNPYTKITHSLFSPEEYLYADEKGDVYDENGYLFEDWQGSKYSAHNGLRMRSGGNWEDGWRVIT